MTSELPPRTVQELVRIILQADLEEQLIRKETLGDAFSFEAGREDFERALQAVRSIQELPTESLEGTEHYTRLRDALDTLLERLREISNFSPDTDQPTAARDRLLRRVRGNISSLLEHFIPVAGYLVLQSGGLRESLGRLDQLTARIESRTGELLADRQERLDDVIREAQESASSARQAAEAAQSAAGQTGVARYSPVFEEEASRHEMQARSWFMWGLLALGALVGIAAVIILIPVGDDIRDPQVVQWVLLKALLVSFLSYLVLQVFRLFRSERHLAVTNRHRYMALLTFETFAGATDDGPTKDAVLLEATRTIFAPGATGLVDQGDAAGGPATLLEIIRRTQGPTPTGN